MEISLEMELLLKQLEIRRIILEETKERNYLWSELKKDDYLSNYLGRKRKNPELVRRKFLKETEDEESISEESFLKNS